MFIRQIFEYYTIEKKTLKLNKLSQFLKGRIKIHTFLFFIMERMNVKITKPFDL